MCVVVWTTQKSSSSSSMMIAVALAISIIITLATTSVPVDAEPFTGSLIMLTARPNGTNNFVAMDANTGAIKVFKPYQSQTGTKSCGYGYDDHYNRYFYVRFGEVTHRPTTALHLVRGNHAPYITNL